MQVFEGRVIEGDPNACGHIICTVAGSGANRQTINYSTERVVGNGSFGVVFQATCLESGETVRSNRGTLDTYERHNCALTGYPPGIRRPARS